MKLTTTAFAEMGAIPEECAFGAKDAAAHVRLAGNRNPDLAWTGAPSATRSFVVICHDPDVPSRGDDVNQEGRVISAALPRVDFCHWVLVDLPADVTRIERGELSDGITAGGKPGPAAKHGARQGVNDYTAWFAGDAQMKGDYYGYDGPCPPWNDEIAHRYVFTVYALDVPRLPVEGRFAMQAVRDAMKDHILAASSVTGRYSLNPAVRL
jgi:Raf kinase inhibitor-like YbhB/YbcL family protein